MTNAAATAATAAPGTVLKSVDAGHAQVRIVKAVGGYTVTVWQAAQPVDGWVDSFATRAATKAAFDHAVAAFTAHGSAAGIERTWNRYAVDRQHLQDRLARSRDITARTAYRARINAVEADMAALEDFATRRLVRQASGDRDLLDNLTIPAAA